MTHGQRYHIVEKIAAGGMAEVYRGETAGIEGFRKRVAIKRVLPKLSQNEEFISMFLDEARLGAYLSHSKCVQVFDTGQGGGSHFIVMEYVDGADLKGVLEHLQSKGRLLPVEVACRIAIDVCEGLAYAHQACDHAGQPLAIVHRDISPHNVLLTRFGEVKLVDFGLARASSHLTEEDEDMVKGKFGYLAPEVTLGQGSDKRLDIFAAGILLWEMLTGRRLFQGANDLETFKLVRAANVPDPRQYRKEVSEDLLRVLLKALARDPTQRYQTADEFARDLTVVLLRQGKPVSYQDIGGYVRETADERDRQRKQKGVATGVMGDLIIDALHEFSSGEPASVRAAQMHAPPADSPDAVESFVDPAAWGLDALFDESIRPKPPQAPPKPAVRAAPAKPEARPPTPAPRPAPPAEQRPAAMKPSPKAATPTQKEGPFWRRWFSG